MRYETDIISKKIKRNKIIKRILIILFYILLIPTILFSLFLLLLELGKAKEFPSFLNIDVYTVTSNSMNPKLGTNDIIIIKKGYRNEEYKIGNIITFKREDGEIITHRINQIVKVDLQNAYITKGDNNEAVDEGIVKYNMIIGKVIYTMPKLGVLIKLLKNKFFLILCILLLMLIIVYDSRLRNKKIERKQIREKHSKKSDFYF